MGRGLLLGLIWGMLIMVVAVALLSLTQPLPNRPRPAAAVMEPDTDAGVATLPNPENATPPDADLAVDSAPQIAADPAAPASETPDSEMPASEMPVVPTDPAPVASDPASEIPLPAGSEFNRPPAEEAAALPGIDTGPASAPAALTQLAAPTAPPLPNTAPAPQPVATATLEAPAAAELPDAAAPAPAQGDDPLPPPPELQPVPLGLPSIEAEPEAAAAPAPEGSPLQRLTGGDDRASPVAVPETPLPPAEGLPAIEAYAAPFDADETRPLMAVILIDDPSFPLGRDALTRFDFPVTFAIDPSRPDAAEAAAQYRAAGFEVVLLAEGFDTTGDEAGAAALLRAGFEVLPEAVAVLDSASAPIQSNRPVLESVVAVLAETGHGLIAYPRGLNVAEQTATRATVPAETLFREIDQERERATVITRYLDRAAFAAGQEGRVIVVGHTYSDTVTALFSWALGSRSENVALAPVSAVLTR